MAFLTQFNVFSLYLEKKQCVKYGPCTPRETSKSKSGYKFKEDDNALKR